MGFRAAGLQEISGWCRENDTAAPISYRWQPPRPYMIVRDWPEVAEGYEWSLIFWQKDARLAGPDRSFSL